MRGRGKRGHAPTEAISLELLLAFPLLPLRDVREREPKEPHQGFRPVKDDAAVQVASRLGVRSV